MSDRLMPERLVIGATYNSMMQFMTWRSNLRHLAPGERFIGRFILPPFQRGLVWTEAQNQRLIESIYLGLPIGALIWNQTRADNPCDGWLLDGQQRTNAMIEYMEGAFPVFGWKFPDLPFVERSHFLRNTVALIETAIEDEATCRDIYDRLVYGGTPHDQ